MVKGGWIARVIAPLILVFGLVQPVAAERVCVEEAGGVCLKYRDAPKSAPKLTLSAAEQRLSPEERRDVQGHLSSLGFYNGGLDGLFGPGTRRSIAAWQSSAGFNATGELTSAQIKALNTGPNAATTSSLAPSRSREAMLIGGQCQFTTTEGSRATSLFRANNQISVETDDGGLNGRWKIDGETLCMTAQGRRVCLDVPPEPASEETFYAAMRDGCVSFKAP